MLQMIVQVAFSPSGGLILPPLNWSTVYINERKIKDGNYADILFDTPTGPTPLRL